MPHGPDAFRPARKTDAPSLAELVNYAGEGMPLYLWSKLARSGEDPWEIGRTRAAREEGAFSYRNAVVADIGGECAGCLIGYDIPDAVASIPGAMPPMFVPLQELENLAPGTWYVNVLGVKPQFRSRGLGGKFLAFAEREARARGLRGLSLIVADENRGARRLYERAGFRDTATRKMVKEDWTSASENWVLMVKPF